MDDFYNVFFRIGLHNISSNCCNFYKRIFRVLAQNENGEDSAFILVTVTAPPSPAGKPVVIDITGTTCILRYEY